MTFREFFEVLENIPAVQNVNDFWWGTSWWQQTQQIQNDDNTLQTDTVSQMSTWAIQQTSNNYGYAISAVAGLTVVGSAIYVVKKRKVVDDDFCHI